MTLLMYNENDPFAAGWLTRLREGNLIPGGSIDGRSITELNSRDCAPTSHFFAGIGGWAYALELAGWDTARDVWTGSCPCQPFSIAGKGSGTTDQRHLWPIWRDLIAECHPPTIFGEQTSSKLGREWLSGVRTDLEALGYAVGAADLCAASLNAPHRRQRLYWVAHTGHSGDRRWDGLADSEARSSSTARESQGGDKGGEDVAGVGTLHVPTDGGSECRRTDTVAHSRGGWRQNNELRAGRNQPGACGTVDQMHCWDRYDIAQCRAIDGSIQYRRIEPGTMPVADGLPNRVGRIRGYGNAIVPQVAATFISAFLASE